MSKCIVSLHHIIVFALLMSCFGIAFGQIAGEHVNNAKGQTSIVVKEEGCPVLKPYRDLDKFGKFYFTEIVYEEARAQTDYECRHIWYMSDELPVSGYIFK